MVEFAKGLFEKKGPNLAQYGTFCVGYAISSRLLPEIAMLVCWLNPHKMVNLHCFQGTPREPLGQQSIAGDLPWASGLEVLSPTNRVSDFHNSLDQWFVKPREASKCLDSKLKNTLNQRQQTNNGDQ